MIGRRDRNDVDILVLEQFSHVAIALHLFIATLQILHPGIEHLAVDFADGAQLGTLVLVGDGEPNMGFSTPVHADDGRVQRVPGTALRPEVFAM